MVRETFFRPVRTMLSPAWMIQSLVRMAPVGWAGGRALSSHGNIQASFG